MGQPCTPRPNYNGKRTVDSHRWNHATFTCELCGGVADDKLRHALAGAWKHHRKPRPPKPPKEPEAVFYSAPVLTDYALKLIEAAEKSTWIPKAARVGRRVADHVVPHGSYRSCAADTAPRRNGMLLMA